MSDFRLEYEPSPAHKVHTTEAGPPRWNPEKSKCPVDLTLTEREELLRDSIARDGSDDCPHRFAMRRTSGGLEFFETRLTAERPGGKIVVHGYPTQRVPPQILRAWRKAGLINNAEFNRLRKDLS